MGAYQDVLCCAVKPNPQTDRTEPGLSGLLSTGGGTRGRLNKCASVCVCVYSGGYLCWMSERIIKGILEQVCRAFEDISVSCRVTTTHNC